MDKCIVCGSKHLDHFSRSWGGDGYNGKCCAMVDGPNEATCEECGAEYLEDELVTEYYLARWMPEAVRDYLRSKHETAS